MTANTANNVEVDANAVVDVLCRQVADLTRQNAILTAANSAMQARLTTIGGEPHECPVRAQFVAESETHRYC